MSDVGYYKDEDGKIRGPFPPQEFGRLAVEGHITRSTLIRLGKEGVWRVAGNMRFWLSMKEEKSKKVDSATHENCASTPQAHNERKSAEKKSTPKHNDEKGVDSASDVFASDDHIRGADSSKPDRENSSRGRMRAEEPTEFGSTMIRMGPRQSFAAIVVLLVFAAGTAFIVCEQQTARDAEIRQGTLELFVLAIGVGWAAFSISERAKAWFLNTLILAAWWSPLLALTLFNLSTPAFLGCLAVTICISVLLVFIEIAPDDPPALEYKHIFTALYFVWLLVCVLVTVISSPQLPGAISIGKHSGSLFLDSRLVVSAILFGLNMAVAVHEAVKDGDPKVRLMPEFRRLRTSSSVKSLFSAVVTPFVMTLDVLVRACLKVVNLLSILVQFVAVYFYRTGVHFGQHVRDLVTNDLATRALLKVLPVLLLVTFFAKAVRLTVPVAVAYLQEDFSILRPGTDAWARLTWMLVLFGSSMIAIVFGSWLWFSKDYRLQCVFGGAMLAMIFLLSGMIMYGIAMIPEANVIGFNSPGIYLFMLIPIFIVGCGWKLFTPSDADGSKAMPHNSLGSGENPR